MLRQLFAGGVLLWAAAGAHAHFVFVVPEPQGKEAKVILSEGLEPDEEVKAALVEGSKLLVRDAAGKETPLALRPAGDHAYAVALAGDGPRVVHGTADLGVQQRGDAKPFRLTYHPKTILGDAFAPAATLGELAPAELIPSGKAGELKFQLVAGGKPQADAEITVILPDKSEKKVKTDKDGRTEAFPATGRYGAWARYFETAAGEAGGKKYGQVRHYPTLVIDVGGPAAAAGAAASRFKPLPEATSSFGAVAAGGWMYVYGGHVARTHSYSTDAVSGKFYRTNLSDGTTWETLPGGPALQGMNLATHNGKVYRVGGMQPRNKPGDKADNYSVADAARFDPAAGQWEYLPPMPEGRSSHDVVVVGDKLYVVGGWVMNGKAGQTWPGTMLVLDLAAAKPQWETVKQPFERRALIAAAHGGKIYVLGGFDEGESATRQVDVYDPASGAWTTGPEFPGKDLNGFAPAACSLGGTLYISVGDGTFYRLNEPAKAWDKVTTTTPRIVHRLIPNGSEILVVGGASKGENLNLIETVQVGEKGPARAEVRAP